MHSLSQNNNKKPIKFIIILTTNNRPKIEFTSESIFYQSSEADMGYLTNHIDFVFVCKRRHFYSTKVIPVDSSSNERDKTSF